MKLLAYFPIFGWFFPMFLTKNEAASWHARQGFGLFVHFVLWSGVVWFVAHAIPRFLKPFEIILLFSPITLYLVLLLVGAVNCLRDNIRESHKPLPIVGKWSEKLPV